MKKQKREARVRPASAVTSFSALSSPVGKPKHPGAVIAQFARCGKPNCRCAEGKLHGPYWYLFRRVGGRLRKTYLRPGEVEAARSACQEWRSLQASLLAQRRETMGLFRQMRQALRDIRSRG